MVAVLELNPNACKGFEMHAFKPGQCRDCRLGWKQHKGAIDDAMCKKLYEDEQKREAEKQAKAAPKGALEKNNTLENRWKKRQSNAMYEMPKDDWYCDEEGESGVDDGEPEDDQFTMQVMEQNTTPAQLALKGVKVRNLLAEEFGSMDETALPSPDKQVYSPPDSTTPDAPVELFQVLSLRLEELKEQETNRKAAESSRKEADDYRQDLELAKIENEVLREELKDAHKALRRAEQEAKALLQSDAEQSQPHSCGTGEEVCVQTNASRLNGVLELNDQQVLISHSAVSVSSLDDEETPSGLVLHGPISLPISGPRRVANYAEAASKEAMRCAAYCFGFMQYYAQRQSHSSASSPEPPSLGR